MEATRWITAISRTIDHHKHPAEGSESETPSISHASASSMRGSISSRMPSILKVRSSGKVNADSSVTSFTDNEGPSGSASNAHAHAQGLSQETGYDADAKDDEDDSLEAEESMRNQEPPHSDTFELQANTLSAQLEVTSNLLGHVNESSTTTEQTKSVLKESLATVQSLTTQYIQMVTDREVWWKARVKKEQERQSFWEESLASVVREGEALEEALKQQARSGSKKRSRILAEGSTGDGQSETDRFLLTPIFFPVLRHLSHC